MLEEVIKDRYKKMNLNDAAKAMDEIKKSLESAKVVKTELQAKFDFLRLNVIPDLMDGDDISNITFDNIGRVTLTSDVYASIPAAKKLAAHKWLRDSGHGDLIKETINSGTLKAFAKEQLKNGFELPVELFKVTPYSRASITKIGG